MPDVAEIKLFQNIFGVFILTMLVIKCLNIQKSEKEKVGYQLEIKHSRFQREQVTKQLPSTTLNQALEHKKMFAFTFN